MKTIVRITALILVFLLFTGCFTGCGNANTIQPTAAVATTKKQPGTEPQMLKLPYSKAEVLNPFEMKSMINRQLSALIYDSLFRVDSAWKPLPVIAKSYKTDGLKITVSIKTGLKFSDGSALDADDIVYSFTQARTSPAFAEHLSNFQSASRFSDTGVVFTLKSADPYAVNCLDFAVIKYYDKSDSPLGSGRYRLSQSKGEQYLTANKTRL
ncbi:MAG: ABC transporter substrate-binding protein, partial [Eubacteriales bacterium]